MLVQGCGSRLELKVGPGLELKSGSGLWVKTSFRARA